MRDVLTWYWLNGRETLNLGEHFVELILPRLGCRPRSFDVAQSRGEIRSGDPCLLVIGSELHTDLVGRLIAAGCRVHVWGQGNGRGADRAVDMREARWRDNVTIHALRGPLTKRVSHVDAGVPLCDPGFLLPQFFPHPVARSPRHPFTPSPVVYVPHHLNTRRISIKTAARIGVQTVLDVMVHRDRALLLVRRIAAAEFALCNSLHAWITALAYRTPCAICLTEDEELNMPDKWQDVLESLGWSGRRLPIVQSLEEGQRWWQTEGRHLVLPDTAALLKAFPTPDP